MLFEFLTGKFLTIIAFIAAIFSMMAFFKASVTTISSQVFTRLIKYGQNGYMVMLASIAIVGLRFMYIILTHQFEYSYVKSYSSSDLNLFYLISTFYAGQEGSFLLWTFLAGLFGLFVMKSSRAIEPRIVVVILFSQVFMLSMLLGVEVPGLGVIGSDLFALVPGVVQSADMFSIVLKHIHEGNGLNPLLQNPWMVIHPPVLFVGFAGLLIPFAYAVASIWKKEYDNWVEPAMPWTVFSTTMLGMGIIMGGYWSYKVLGWGGYWGWDPVENSSLVPWLIGTALIHTMLIQKKNGALKRTNLALAALSYISVLYSTFLTRSGVLGDFSVHSFADLGLYRQLLTFVLVFLILGIGFLLVRIKSIPNIKMSQNLLSRDFMLIGGAIVLLFIGLVIASGTSAPIINRLFTSKPDPVLPEFYNRVTLPLAVLMAGFLTVAPFVGMKVESGKALLKSILPAVITGLLFSALLMILGLKSLPLALLALTAMSALVANLQKFIGIVRVQPLISGGALTHVGLALMLLGILAGHYDRSEQLELTKNEPANSFGKSLTYKGLEKIDPEKEAFLIEIVEDGKTSVAKPMVHQTRDMTLQIPEVLHAFHRDFYISPINLFIDRPNQVILQKNIVDSIGEYHLKLVGFKFELPDTNNRRRIQIRSVLNVEYDGLIEQIEPMFEIAPGQVPKSYPAKLSQKPEVRFSVTNINAENKSILVKAEGIEGLPEEPNEILLIEASIKPFINVLWIGTYVLTFGFMLSIYRRWKEQKQ